MYVPVDNADDPRLVELTSLTDARARARIEAEHGCFVAEGWIALESALRSQYPIRSVLVAEPKVARLRSLLGATPGFPVHVAPPDLLEAVAGFDVHRGLLASVGRLPLPDADSLLAGAELVLAVEEVVDHENIGALFRNAAAFGVDAVVLDRRCADPLYRRSVRVSSGQVLHVPWTRVGSIAEWAGPLGAAGFRVAALTPRGDVSVHEIEPVDADSPLVWLVGSEGPGLTPDALAAATERVAIPITPAVDSLNVATAAAIAFALSRR